MIPLPSISIYPKISFTIAGVTYPLNPVDFVIDIGNDECVGGTFNSSHRRQPES